VGITRAMKTLTISYCAERAKYGKRAAAMPSRFLFEMRGKEPPDDWVAVEASSAAVEETPARARTRKK
jgi:ATP-dependent DNA helicase Rep